MGKVLVIGLDGMSPELLKLLIKRGVFSNIGSLRKQGVYADLISAYPPVTAPAWVSFATGANPGKHGIFAFALPQKTLLDIKSVTSQDLKLKTFYELLYEQGKKNILINLPVSWPPLTSDATLTSLLTRSEELVYPAELKDEFPILKKYRIVPSKSPEDGQDYINEIRKLEKDRFECAKALIKSNWDFFFTLFSGTDWLSHYAYDRLISDSASEQLLDFFREIDDYVGELCNMVGDDTDVLIISDHGFRVAHKQFNINEWLAQKGYLSKSGKRIVREQSHAFVEVQQKMKQDRRFGLPEIVWVLKVPVLSKIAVGFYKIIKKLLPFGMEFQLGIGPETRAYSPTPESYGIYINRKDVFEDGIVSGAEYESLRDEIVEKLLCETDPGNGEKVFLNVWKKEDIYQGSQLADAPDIVVSLRPDYFISTSIKRLKLLEKCMVCDHDITGIFIGKGSNVKKNCRIEKAHIVDITPTILQILDSSIPDNLDGKVLFDIFSDDSSKRNCPRYIKAEKPDRNDSAQADKEVIDRLKSLGYIE